MKKLSINTMMIAVFPLLLAVSCSQAPPQTAEEVLERSVAAHGGEALTKWKTLTIKGTVVMNDGVDYNAAYLLFAEKPGKLRVEQDMTADRGRLFYEYFLNNGVAWRRNNLSPGRGNLKQMQRMLNLCDGIAYFANNADGLTLKEEGVVELKEKPEARGEKPKVVRTIPAYVVEAVIGEDKSELYFDKETLCFIQEKFGNTTRVYSDFKKFGDVTLATKIQESVVIKRGERTFERFLPYTYETVEYDIPIEQWLFEEDMPKRAAEQQ